MAVDSEIYEDDAAEKRNMKYFVLAIIFLYFYSVVSLLLIDANERDMDSDISLVCSCCVLASSSSPRTHRIAHLVSGGRVYEL